MKPKETPACGLRTYTHTPTRISINLNTITAMAESVLAKRKRKTMKFERENAKGLLRLPLDQYSI